MNSEDSMHGEDPMRGDGDDYLWDRSGPVDPEIARLERLLGGYAHAGTPRRARTGAARGARRPRRRWRIALAAAAMLAVCAIGVRGWYQQRLQWQAGRPWQVVAQQGEVRIDGRRLEARATLGLDDTLETGAHALTRLRAAGIGEIALGRDSRLRLVETRTGRHRVQLQQGSLWARVWAPPGQFGVGVAGADVLTWAANSCSGSMPTATAVLPCAAVGCRSTTSNARFWCRRARACACTATAPPGRRYAHRCRRRIRGRGDAIDARNGRVAAMARRSASCWPWRGRRTPITLLSLLQAHPRLGDGPIVRAHGPAVARGTGQPRCLGQGYATPSSTPGGMPCRTLGSSAGGCKWPDVLPARDAKLEAWLRQPGRRLTLAVNA